jgi:hypothetical protein
MHIAINISNLPIFKTTDSSNGCEFFLYQTQSFPSKSMLSYCTKIDESQFVTNSTLFTIHIESTGSDMFAAGHDSTPAQQQNAILLIL